MRAARREGSVEFGGYRAVNNTPPNSGQSPKVKKKTQSVPIVEIHQEIPAPAPPPKADPRLTVAIRTLVSIFQSEQPSRMYVAQVAAAEVIVDLLERAKSEDKLHRAFIIVAFDEQAFADLLANRASADTVAANERVRFARVLARL